MNTAKLELCSANELDNATALSGQDLRYAQDLTTRSPSTWLPSTLLRVYNRVSRDTESTEMILATDPHGH